jgi:translation elongation factor EF-G
VAEGAAITDGLKMEKSSGISIKASSVCFTWNSTLFQLVDTPGHIDFCVK